jgi:hypothetical protein
MDVPQEHIESLARNVEQYEQKARRRAWLSTLVPLLFGGVLLGYTIWQVQFYGQKLTFVQGQLNETTQELGTTINDLENTREQLGQADTDLGAIQDQLAQTQKDLEQTRGELEKTKQELEEATQALKDVNVFIANSYPVDIFALKGGLPGEYPPQEDVLLDITELQFMGTPWNRNGFSEEEGFNSPNFAVYMLQKHGIISDEYGPAARPWEFLRPVTEPSMGDLVYYEGGYTMFYYELEDGPFVIGMTPIGILSLDPDFAPPLGYLEVPY